MEQFDWSACKNILCIRPDNMGDVLMTQPALRALKQSLPDRKITLLTSKPGAEIAPKLPEVDELITFDLPWIKTDAMDNDNKAVENLVSEIKTNDFDAAVIFTNYSQSALPSAMICYLAAIPQVLAYSRTNPYDLINNWLPDNEPFEFPVHGVQRQLNLVEAAGAVITDKKMRLTVEKNREKAVLEKLTAEGFNMQKPWLVLHPGVSEDKRKYPPMLYGKASELLTQKRYQILVTGLKCEDNLAKCVVRSSGAECFNLAGKLSLDDFIALIGLASIIVTNNTASVHIAAAVNTPVVDLYARTNPEHTPWMVAHRTLYFDVPKSIRSKNTTLVHTTPDKRERLPQPNDIATAVDELLGGVPLTNSEISAEKMNWSYERSNRSHTHLQPEHGAGGDAHRPLFSILEGV